MTNEEPVPMSRVEIMAEQAKIGLVLRALDGCNIAGLLAEYERAEAVGWFLDPTAYRDGIDSRREWAGILKPLLEIQVKMAPLVAAAKAIDRGRELQAALRSGSPLSEWVNDDPRGDGNLEEPHDDDEP